MIRKTHVTLEETVGEFTVSTHLPVGISFDASIQILKNMVLAIEQFAQEAAAQAEAEKAAQDVAQPETTPEVAGA